MIVGRVARHILRSTCTVRGKCVLRSGHLRDFWPQMDYPSQVHELVNLTTYAWAMWVDYRVQDW